MARQTIDLPDDIKRDLNEMSKELGMTQSALMVLAINTLVARYREDGMKIFFDLLTPKKKENR